MKAKKLFAGIMAFTMLGASFTGCGTTEDSSSKSKTNAESSADSKQSDNYTDTITLVWYPNESAEDYQEARNEVGKLIEQATGAKADYRLCHCHRVSFQWYGTDRLLHGCRGLYPGKELK